MKNKNKVSYKNVDLIIFTSILIIGTYFIERVLHLKFEFVPITFTVRRHIVGGANRTLFSVDLPPRWCRTGTCRRLQSE